MEWQGAVWSRRRQEKLGMPRHRGFTPLSAAMAQSPRSADALLRSTLRHPSTKEPLPPQSAPAPRRIGLARAAPRVVHPLPDQLGLLEELQPPPAQLLGPLSDAPHRRQERHHLELEARHVVLAGRVRVEPAAVHERVAQPVARVMRQHLRLWEIKMRRSAGAADQKGGEGASIRSEHSSLVKHVHRIIVSRAHDRVRDEGGARMRLDEFRDATHDVGRDLAAALRCFAACIKRADIALLMLTSKQ